jgi:FkbH-like protein
LNIGAGQSRTSSLLSSGRAFAWQLQECIDEVVSRLITDTTRGRENRFQDGPDQLRDRVQAEVTLLIKYLGGRPDFGALYAGQRIFELTHLERTREQNIANYRSAVAADKEVYLTVLRKFLPRVELTEFEKTYDHVTAALVTEPSGHVRTLFVGDCIQAEIQSFLIGPLMSDGLSIEPFPINPRDPTQLSQILDSLSTKAFDIVFFSPFSHARLPEIAALLDQRRVWRSSAETRRLVAAIIEQTQALVKDLAKRFECPIFVHNAGLIPRSTNLVKSAAQILLTCRARGIADGRINQWLTDYIATANAMTFQHLFLIDEVALVREHGRGRLGQYISSSEYQHAVALSQRLAEEYRLRVAAVGRLVGRKLVVCDLDNTLWDGVIGEGPVKHFNDRQSTLKNLKSHSGVVLSIASKNDPGNVHFDGGILEAADFVAPQISWGQKSEAINKISRKLNLQTKHMVFLDDRPDERAMVCESFPDICALDPADPRTWEMMGLWSAMTFGVSDIDRTRLYQDQTLRDAVAGDSEADGPANADTLAKLGLVITISPAKRGDLKRVAELINRTNQWNLCGSRTSFQQVREWNESDDWHIFIANVSDRFGDMGTVCVSVFKALTDRIEIPVFVLSCRVFGYGVETAMLKEIGKLCAIGTGNKALVGHFRSSTQNHPCRNMYRDHGFTQDGDAFTWSGIKPLPDVPWAEIKAISD